MFCLLTLSILLTLLKYIVYYNCSSIFSVNFFRQFSIPQIKAQMVALDENKLSKVWKSECHKSITYGACWLPERKLFCTSSFYDKKLVSWGYAE